MSEARERRLLLASVVDSDPRLWVELVLWVLCVSRNLPRAHVRPVVYSVGDLPDALAQWVTDEGVEVREAVAPVPGSPHCNKIIPFAADPQSDPFAPTHVAVADLDLFLLSDPRPYLGWGRFRAAPNMHSNPPPAVWRNVLAASGLGRPFRSGLSLFPGRLTGLRETHVNNINAGFVVAPVDRAGTLADRWEHWARFLVANRGLLDQWGVHVDQVGFALAMEDLDEDVEFLPATLNAVLHLLPEIDTPVALHLSSGHLPKFPEVFSRDGGLRAEALRPGCEGWVQPFNALVREAGRVIEGMACLSASREMFLNPAWRRE